MTFSIALRVLVETIINNYFHDSRCMFIFSDNFRSFEYNGNVSFINIFVNQTINDELIFNNYGCQVFLINHSNASSIIMQLESQMKLYDDRFNSRKYLIIPTEFANTLEEDIFSLPALYYIVDLLVIIPEQNFTYVEECEDIVFQLYRKSSCNNNFNLLTHKYAGKHDNNARVVLDIWISANKTFLYHNDLYPDKITDQKGRTLRCATFDYKPYSIIEKVPTLGKGAENSIAHEFIKKYNMTLQYITDDDEWGAINDNWTGNGILGNIATDKADIGYAALYIWPHEYTFLDFSKYTIRAGVSCLVPAPKLAAGWLTPFLPFSFYMWICTGISFIIIWITVYIVTVITSKRHRKRNKSQTDINHRILLTESFVRVVQVFFVQSVSSTENVYGIAFRYTAVMFLFSVFMSSTYSSGLATVMTIPRYEGAINTVQDLADSGMHWGGTGDAWLFSILAEETPKYVTLVKMFITTTEENLIEYSKTDYFAFPVERLQFGQYAVGSYLTEDVVQKLRLLHEDMYWGYCVFMLRKSTPLLNLLDKFLLQLAQSGLIHFWEMKAAQINMNLRIQNMIGYYVNSNKKKEVEDTVKLKWMHVEGTFGLLIAGYIISCLVFLYEITEHKYKKNRGTE